MATDDETQAATCRFEMVEYLPAGRLVYPVEVEGELVWLILQGEMTDRLLDELNEYARFVTSNRLWTQQWDGPRTEPSHLLRAS